jgi:hypothetical protein
MLSIEAKRGKMADLIVVYWRDIPAQVIVKKGRQNAKRELPVRFGEAIDMAAMRSGASDTDDYLAEWRKADPVPVGDDLEAEAEKAAADFDAQYLHASASWRWPRQADGKWLRRSPRRRWSRSPRRNRTTSRPTCRRSGAQRSYSVRLWSIRHSRALEWFYAKFADMFLLLHPLWKGIGYGRVEAPVKFVEKREGFHVRLPHVRPVLLSSTGMSCPMNCPKQLRNGPCGGVRANGNCEVEPDMPCVWVKAWEGSRNMVHGDKILTVQKPVDQSLRETSAWLRVTAQAAGRKKGQGGSAGR